MTRPTTPANPSRDSAAAPASTLPPSSFFRDTRAAGSDEPVAAGRAVDRSASQVEASGSVASSLAALCLIARLHHVPADPAQLCHALGWPPNHHPNSTDFLLAAKHLGLKATLTRTTPDRLSLTPLPALALIRGDAGTIHTVVLAQCDGQRVLFQDPAAAGR